MPRKISPTKGKKIQKGSAFQRIFGKQTRLQRLEKKAGLTKKEIEEALRKKRNRKMRKF